MQTGPVSTSSNHWRVLALLMLAGAVPASAQEERTYRIEPGPDSRFELLVDKTGLMRGKQHRITFDRYQGTLRYDAAQPERARVELIIAAASLDVRDSWLGTKDQTKVKEYARQEMLAVGKYPELRFASTAVRRDGEAFAVDGTLTIRGVARPATVRVRLTPGAQGTLALAGESNVVMTQYGLKPPSAGLGTVGTKDEMRVTFDVRARPEP